jgi:hypothetical protein
MTHTPEPWVRLDATISTPAGCAICDIAYAYSGLPKSELDANTRLILAAPRLLAALRSLLASDNSSPYDIAGSDVDGHPLNSAGVARRAARAAIAEATGKTP